MNFSSTAAHLKTSALRHYWLALLVCAVWGALYAPWLAGQRVIPWDALDYFYPNVAFIVQSLRQGDLPFWNPYVYSGYPMISDPQTMLFAPIMLLISLGGSPSVFWFNVCIFLHVLAGALGFAWLCRHYRYSTFGTILGTLVFIAGGAAAARLEHVSQILAYSLFPFVLCFCKRVLDDPRPRNIAGLGVSLACSVVYFTQPSYLMALVIAAYAAVGIATRFARSKVFPMRASAALLAAAVIGVLLVSPQVAPTFASLHLSNRPVIEFSSAAGGSLGPAAFWTLGIPNIFNSLVSSPAHPYSGPNNVVESLLYVGVTPLLLIVFAAAGRGFQLRAPSVWPIAAAIGVFAVIYALGAYTPFYRLAYDYLPGVKLFRRPTDATYLVNFSIALLTAHAGNWLSGVSPDAGTRLARALLWCSLLALAAIGLMELEKGLLSRSLIVVLAMTAAVSLWVALARRRVRVGYVLVILVVLTALDLRIHNLNGALNGHKPNAGSEYWGPDVLHDLLMQGIAKAGNPPARVEAIFAGNTWAGAAPLYQIPLTHGYNVLLYEPYRQIFGALHADAWDGTRRPFTNFMLSYSSPLFNLLGARYIVSSRKLTELDPAADPEAFPFVMKWHSLSMWENPRSLPRILAPERQRTVDLDDPDAARLLGETDFLTTVLLHPGLPGSRVSNPPEAPQCGGGRAQASLGSYRNSSVTLQVAADAPAWVVLTDLYHPWWHAYVDGVEVKLWQANGLFRAVCVPGGKRELSFRFEPYRLSNYLRAQPD